MNIAELRRLEAEATPGLVRSYELSGGDVIVETVNSVPLRVARFHQGAIVDAKREAFLYVAMRNALPELLKALETPVAWRAKMSHGYAHTSSRKQADDWSATGATVEPLFAIPPHGGGDV